jgi:DNA-binding NarL/FixJ family response regulator
MDKVRIVLADDHQILLDGLQSLFEKQGDFLVVGKYNNGIDLYEELRNTQPDIAIIDINMPGLNGHELTLKIKKEFGHIKVIILSMFDDITHITQFVKAGVSAYLLKNINNEGLLRAMYEVEKGNTFFSEEISAKLIAFKKAEKNAPGGPALTNRELQILKLITIEYSNAQIADALFISERTVETHRKNMLRKTNHKNMIGLLKFVFDSNLIRY